MISFAFTITAGPGFEFTPQRVKQGLIGDIFSRYANDSGEIPYENQPHGIRGGGWLYPDGPDGSLAIAHVEYAEEKPHFDTFEKIDAFLKEEGAPTLEMFYQKSAWPKNFKLPLYGRLVLL